MNAQPLTLTVDPETAAILEQEVAAGHFSSVTAALKHAVQQLERRRHAVAKLSAIADEALADMDDLVDFDTVRRDSRAAIDRASAQSGA